MSLETIGLLILICCIFVGSFVLKDEIDRIRSLIIANGMLSVLCAIHVVHRIIDFKSDKDVVVIIFCMIIAVVSAICVKKNAEKMKKIKKGRE